MDETTQILRQNNNSNDKIVVTQKVSVSTVYHSKVPPTPMYVKYMYIGFDILLNIHEYNISYHTSIKVDTNFLSSLYEGSELDNCNIKVV